MAGERELDPGSAVIRTSWVCGFHGGNMVTDPGEMAEEARDLLINHLGAARVAGEPDAVAELIGACGRLPLALGIVAARATTHPGVRLAELAEELRDEAHRLDGLELDPGVTAVVAAGRLFTHLEGILLDDELLGTPLPGWD